MMYGGTSCSIAHGRTFAHLYARHSVVECILCHNVIVAHLHSPTQSSRIQLGRDFDSGQPKQNRDCGAGPYAKYVLTIFRSDCNNTLFKKGLITSHYIAFIFVACELNVRYHEIYQFS